VSNAAVALAHGINANLARRWVVEAERRGGGTSVKASTNAVAAAFVPVQLPSAQATPADIRVELRRGPIAISVSWPCAAASECAAWMRELLQRSASTCAPAAIDYSPEWFKCSVGQRPITAICFATRAPAGSSCWCTTASMCSAARRLNVGSFEWPRCATDGTSVTLTPEQFDALVLGLPWLRLEQLHVITRM